MSTPRSQCSGQTTLDPKSAKHSDAAIRTSLGLPDDAPLPTSFDLADSIAEVAKSISALKAANDRVEAILRRDYDQQSFRALGAYQDQLREERERLDRLKRGRALVRDRERQDPRLRCELLTAFASEVAKELKATDRSKGVEFRLIRPSPPFHPYSRIDVDVRFWVTDAVQVVTGGYEQPFANSPPPRRDEVFEPKPPHWTKWVSVSVLYLDWSSGTISQTPRKRSKSRDFWWVLGTISETFLFVVDVMTLQGIVRRAAARGLRYLVTRTPTLLGRARKNIGGRLMAGARNTIVTVKLRSAPKNLARPLARRTPEVRAARQLTRSPTPRAPAAVQLPGAPKLGQSTAVGKAGNRGTAAGRPSNRGTSAVHSATSTRPPTWNVLRNVPDLPGAFLERGYTPGPHYLTKETTYLVRAGEPGNPGRWGDFLFTGKSKEKARAKAEAYAKALSDEGWREIRNRSALPVTWADGSAGNPVAVVSVWEVPPGTPYVQGVVGPQTSGGPLRRRYPGGGDQVVIPDSRPLVLVKPEIPVRRQ